MRRAVVAIGLSFAVHGAIAASVFVAPRESPLVVAPPTRTTIEIVRTEPIVEPEVEPEAPASNVARVTKRRSRRGRGRVPKRMKGGTIEVPTAPSRAPANEPTPGDDAIATVLEPLPSIPIVPPAPKLVPDIGPPKKPDGPDVDALVPNGDGLIAREGDAVARIQPDGSISFDRPSTAMKAKDIVGGLVFLDPLPLINAITGDDPDAPSKLKILRETCELRLEMRKTSDAENMRRALAELGPRLAQIWRTPAWSAERRRRALFDVWDGCADDDRGATAREIVLAFIEVTIPAGHADAFPPEEIAALNDRRRSNARFEPY